MLSKVCLIFYLQDASSFLPGDFDDLKTLESVSDMKDSIG